MPRKKTVEVEETVKAVKAVEVEETKTDKEIYTPICPVNVRTEPSLEAPVVRVSRVGDEAEVESIEDGWMKLTDGTYTMAEFWAKNLM